MNSKIVVLSWIAWAIAAIFNPSSAQAFAGITELEDPSQLTHVMITPQYYDEFSLVNCDGSSRFFNFQQRMAIPGVGAVWVAAEFLYGPGRKTAALLEVCENESGEAVYIYGLDSCEC